MKCAVLCNGPSRIDYQPSSEYNYVIGCNIPWTEVDATVILDVNVLEQWKTPCKFYSSVDAWRELRYRDRFTNYFLGFVNTIPDYDSAGHAACRKVLEMNPSVINIYGCDSWFINNTDSYTHQYVDSRSVDMTKNVSVWRSRWYDLMDSHKNVEFNFIRKTK
jgi:hypothetical protein